MAYAAFNTKQFLADSASKHTSSHTLATPFMKYTTKLEEKKPTHNLKNIKRKHVEDDEDDRKPKVKKVKHTTTEVDKGMQFDDFMEKKAEEARMEFLVMQEKEQDAKNKTAEKKSHENKTAQKKSAEKKSGEKRSGVKKTGEEKAAEKKSGEKKSEKKKKKWVKKVSLNQNESGWG